MSNVTKTNNLDTVRETFNFTVDRFPITGPDNMSTGMYGMFRSDKQCMVGRRAVSSRYVGHTTDDVLALAESAYTAIENETGEADTPKVNCAFHDSDFFSCQ